MEVFELPFMLFKLNKNKVAKFMFKCNSVTIYIARIKYSCIFVHDSVTNIHIASECINYQSRERIHIRLTFI